MKKSVFSLNVVMLLASLAYLSGIARLMLEVRFVPEIMNAMPADQPTQVALIMLPIVLFFVVYHLNPDYVMLLFTDPLGRKMIAVAAFLQVMGAVCIKKIVNIKV